MSKRYKVQQRRNENGPKTLEKMPKPHSPLRNAHLKSGKYYFAPTQVDRHPWRGREEMATASTAGGSAEHRIPLLRTHPKDARKNAKRHEKVTEWGMVGGGKRADSLLSVGHRVNKQLHCHTTEHWWLRGTREGKTLLDTDVRSSEYIVKFKKK